MKTAYKQILDNGGRISYKDVTILDLSKIPTSGRSFTDKVYQVFSKNTLEHFSDIDLAIARFEELKK